MDSQWYVIYTKRDGEQKLRDSILSYSERNGLDYQAYLPMTTEVRRWSDRKKVKRVAVFKNYLFVKHSRSGFHAIKRMPGFSYYVQFGKYPSVIKPADIDMIKVIVDNHQQISCRPRQLVKGDRVRICKGPLAEYEGTLTRDAEGSKIALEVKNLDQCLQVNIAPENVLPL